MCLLFLFPYLLSFLVRIGWVITCIIILWNKLFNKGLSFIVCLTIVTLILIATFQLHTAGLHHAIESDLLSWAICTTIVVSDWCITNLKLGGFRSKALLALWEEEPDPSAVRCGTGRLSCCLSVGIHDSGISIPLTQLILLGWSLLWIASSTLREYQWGSQSIHLTLSQSG